MEALEVLLDLAAIVEKQIQKANGISDRVESLTVQCAKSEVLTEIYKKIKEARDND